MTQFHTTVKLTATLVAVLITSGVAIGSECGPDEVNDCFGNCVPFNWIDDGLCDDGTFKFNGNPIYLNCVQWGFDGGDCIPSAPVSGTPVPSMAKLDITMLDLMNQEDITAGAMGVMKNGVVVYQRFFGWSDAARTQPLQPDAMMRIASITKPHTAACIRALIADGIINLNDNAFNLGQPTGGLLNIIPFNGLGDPRMANITVNDLLRHRGGWDRDAPGINDLTYKEIEIKTAFNQDAVPTRQQTVAWILSQPLQNTPGATYAYSNEGFLVLGLIVEQFSGLDYETYLHQRVLSPIGVQGDAIEAGRTLPVNQNPREPWYNDQGLTSLNVFASLADLANNPAGQFVPNPEGRWCHELRVGQGGLIATPRELLTFLDTYTIRGNNIGMPRNKATEGAGWTQVHTGALFGGTESIAQQWGDGHNFVAIFNKRQLTAGEDDYIITVRDAFRALLNSGDITVPDCPPGYIFDCNGNCVPEMWLGNGVCDTQTWFGDVLVDFNCAALNFDEGDCDPCPADLDGSGSVDINDFLQMLANFGICQDPSACPSDIDGNGFVDVDDLLVGIGSFGPC